MSLVMDGTFWVFIGLVIFLGLAFKAGAHKAIGAALDKRSDEISNELDQARQLREEAQQLLASYQRKQRDAEQEAQDIIELAEAEAERLAAETREALQVSLERRTKMAEDKITQAEIRAVQEVRDIAANVAISAAETIIVDKLTGDKVAAYLNKSIGEIEDKLH